MIFVWTLQDIIGLIFVGMTLAFLLLVKFEEWNRNRKRRKNAGSLK